MEDREDNILLNKIKSHCFLNNFKFRLNTEVVSAIIQRYLLQLLHGHQLFLLHFCPLIRDVSLLQGHLLLEMLFAHAIFCFDDDFYCVIAAELKINLFAHAIQNVYVLLTYVYAIGKLLMCK